MEVSNALPVSVKMTPQETAKLKSDLRTFNLKNKHAGDPEKARNEVSQDKFLKLLTIQLSKQDPLNPMQNTEFMAQMAQFSALEQMTRVNAGLGKLASLNIQMQSQQFLGKNVGYSEPESGKVFSGFVESIQFDQNGNTALIINGNRVALENIISVNMNVVEGEKK